MSLIYFIKHCFLKAFLIFLSLESIAQISTGVKLAPQFTLPNSCGIIVNAGPDITICAGSGKNLNGMVTGSTSYNWEPPDGLSNPNILNPLANPAMTTTYTLTAMGVSSNIIVNGNFETGSIAPSTTQYTPYTDLNTWAMSTGGYIIMSVPQIVAQFGCNPNVGAFTMAITPTGSSSNIWCQTKPVNPNTDYKITFKLIGIPYIFGPPPDIGLKINGTLVGSMEPASGFCTETTASFVWNSGSSVSANFCLANYGGTGTFAICAIDDITVKECCVEKDVVTVEVYELVAEAAPVDDINCINRPITIDASGSSQGNGISYNWTTTNGHFVSGEKTLMPVVDTPGTYKLKIIGLYGCEKELTVIVNGSVTKPDIKIKTVDIDCKNAFGSIEASSKSSSPQFEWTGPNGYYSTRPINFNIKEPGEYTVKVTDAFGCESTAKTEIKDNRTIIEAEINGDSISCSKDSAILSATSIGKKPLYYWKGPKGYKKDSSSIAVTKDSGWYYLTTVDSFGCSEIDSFYVKDLQNNIAIKIAADTLDCNNNSIQINLQVDTSAAVLWNGPNGFNSTLMQPSVSESGWYYVSVKTKDGCTAFDSVFVVKSSDLPDIYISNNDTIRCDRMMVSISGGTNSTGANFEWQTPLGIFKNQNQLSVSDSGTYKLVVTGGNGCILTKSIYIFKDLTKPILTGSNDTLTCFKDSIQLKTNTANVRSYAWSGPNNFISTQVSPVIFTKGIYTLIVTGLNGCTSDVQIQIEEDKTIPMIQLYPDTISCNKPQVILNVTGDSNIINYHWLGPNNFTNSNPKPAITVGGSYSLEVTGSNGCKKIEFIQILEDTLKPVATLEADTIQCKSMASIRALNISTGARLLWTGPNNFSSASSSSSITNSGYYTLLLTGSNGCQFIDSVFVFQKDQLPDIYANNDTLSCIKQKLFLDGGSATPGVSYEWIGPNGFKSNLQKPEIQDSGIYVLKVIDPNGCEAIKQIYISEFADYAILNLIRSKDTLTCKDSSIRVNVNATLPSKTILWSGPNGFSSTANQFLTNTPGKYLVKYYTQFGCLSLDSFILSDARKLPDFNVADDSINCLKKSIILQLNTNDTDLKFNWQGPSNFSSTLKNPQIQNGGIYTLCVTNTADCKLIKTINIKADTLMPDLSLSADTLTCLRSNAPVKASSSLQGFTMKWTGPNGFSYTLPQFATKIAGRYFCTITNPRSGCSTSSFVDVIEDTSRIRDVIAITQNSNCNKNDGKIQILQILGGALPYKYSLDNGLSFIPDVSQLNLKPGAYSVLVEDSNGCRFSTNVTIAENNGIAVSIPTQITLVKGTSGSIKLNILTNPNDLTSILWSPSDQLSCNDCTDPILTADHDALITVIVTDKNGCTTSASIQLYVKNENKVYFPNAFTPNGDNINDFFYPIGLSPQAKINYFNIYDRWGNLIFQKENSSIISEQDGWNGKSMNQEKVNPGVFIYTLSVTDQNETVIYSGDITLIY